MRTLIVTSPGVGHLFPAIPTAWALRVAGHDVLVATSGYQDLVAQAGLLGVDVAPGVDFGSIFRSFAGRTERPGMEQAAEMFAGVSRPFLDRTVELARDWRPDVVISTQMQGAGAVAAAVVDVPALVHGFNFGHPSGVVQRIAHYLAPDYARFGVRALPPAAYISLAPPSMAFGPAAGHTISVRALPYNGGAVLPDWVLGPRARPRIVITLGSVWGHVGGVSLLKPFVAAAAGVDAEFVLALGGLDLAELGELPANIRPVDWTPLGALLAAADGVIHHGGAGTTLTALDAGVPQYVIPQGADQFMNAEAVVKRGVGEMVRIEQLDTAKLGALPGNPELTEPAQEVAAEMRAQQTPADIVPEIVKLAR